MNKQTDLAGLYGPLERRGLSWGAVFGGVISSTAAGVLLSLLGTSLGLAIFKADPDSLMVLGLKSMIWFVVSGTIAMFICGWISSYFARTSSPLKGALHGLVAWSLATLLGLFIVGSGLGALVSGAGQLIGETLTISGQAMSEAGPKILQAAGGGATSLIKSQQEEIKSMLEPVKKTIQDGANTGKKSASDTMDALLNPSSQASNKLSEAVKDYFGASSDEKKEQLRQAVINQLAENTNLTTDQAAKVVDQWKERYDKATEKLKEKVQQAKEKAQEVAEDASTQLSKAAFAAFLTLLIGASASVAGAYMAVRRDPDQTTKTK